MGRHAGTLLSVIARTHTYFHTSQQPFISLCQHVWCFAAVYTVQWQNVGLRSWCSLVVRGNYLILLSHIQQEKRKAKTMIYECTLHPCCTFYIGNIWWFCAVKLVLTAKRHKNLPVKKQMKAILSVRIPLRKISNTRRQTIINEEEEGTDRPKKRNEIKITSNTCALKQNLLLGCNGLI